MEWNWAAFALAMISFLIGVLCGQGAAYRRMWTRMEEEYQREQTKDREDA